MRAAISRHGRIHGAAIARWGAGGRGEETGRGDCGIRCNGEGRAAGAVVGTAVDEVIVATDTYKHADRLQSYRRVAGVATMIEVKPSVAVGL